MRFALSIAVTVCALLAVVFVDIAILMILLFLYLLFLASCWVVKIIDWFEDDEEEIVKNKIDNLSK